MKIVFMGTPDFAVPSLRVLIAAGHEVQAVYTQPDKPKGRGYKLTPPPVKVLAQENGIPVFQPQTLKDEEVQRQIAALAPDVIVVVAYGKILPQSILELPQYGCINLHGSLLPKYRGAAPIQWSILNGDSTSGVSTMYMAAGVDTGDVILSLETPIGENETADELYTRLSELGAPLLEKTLCLLASGAAPRIPQDDADSSYAPMLTKEMGKIDFSKSDREVHNQIRGLSSWPCAYTIYQGKRLKVYRSSLIHECSGRPGEILDHKRLIVACGTGAVEFLEVQYEGAKRMSGHDFLNGKQIQKGQQFLE
ncbi:MAG TPA: methionyl-tRNA formyltransferase [Firmicutes bacterium]|nr:methionyl-tRNA formyltransferase [Bacillota bacterium]